jgi:hypothetical protein
MSSDAVVRRAIRSRCSRRSLPGRSTVHHLAVAPPEGGSSFRSTTDTRSTCWSRSDRARGGGALALAVPRSSKAAPSDATGACAGGRCGHPVGSVSRLGCLVACWPRWSGVALVMAMAALRVVRVPYLPAAAAIAGAEGREAARRHRRARRAARGPPGRYGAGGVGAIPRGAIGAQDAPGARSCGSWARPLRLTPSNNRNTRMEMLGSR